MKTIASVGEVQSLMDLLSSWRTSAEEWAEDGFGCALDFVHVSPEVPGPVVEAMLPLVPDRTAAGGRLVSRDQLVGAIEEVAMIEPRELRRLLDGTMSLRPLADLVREILAEDAYRTYPSPPAPADEPRHRRAA